MRWVILLLILVVPVATSQPVRVGSFQAEVRLPSVASELPPAPVINDPRLKRLPRGTQIRQAALARDGRLAAATDIGLWLAVDERQGWQMQMPEDGRRSWHPRDVRGTAFDDLGRLWFASPQGIGCLSNDGKWTLYDTSDGIPFDDFTAVAAGAASNIWFGTTAGAIHYDGNRWAYRQGRRWLPDDRVKEIRLDAKGNAHVLTETGASIIATKPMTLAEKAKFFEDEIDKRHRRTEFGYVLTVGLKQPGDTSEWVQSDSDNDGLWTAMYGAGQCYAYAATGDEKARQRAIAAFRALRFLGTVTQGGTNPAPRGFVARTVLPASGPDPNRNGYTIEKDREFRANRDSLWKIISPRWPKSADGKWYWKTDTSSDELDGHFFFYALYYDLVVRTEKEKQEVREHVAAMGDHLVDHNFQYVDHDGKATRWGVFNPEKLNHDRDWYEERGLNSLSILSYLKVASHITGDARYDDAARLLIEKHGYSQNALIPKTHMGPGSGNQSDDEMIFMDFYSLLLYERDPELRRKYLVSFHNHWQLEQPEVNPLFNFLYASLANGVTVPGTHRPTELTPPAGWLEDSIDTLKRIPLDRVNWGVRNSQRKDVRLLPESSRGGARGYLLNGKVLPADERHIEHWNHDPWTLDYSGDGRRLADGNAFLLPYYMGLYHKFIQD